MKKTAYLLLAVLFLSGCAVMVPNKDLNVALKLKRENLDQSTVLVFNFKPPDYAPDCGTQLSEMFHMELLKRKKFKMVSLYNDSKWYRLEDLEEKRLLIAIEEGKEKGFDYILLGDIKEFFYGGINAGRVRITIRLIEVKTQKTILLVEDYKEHKGKDPTYPLNTKLSKRSRSPRVLSEKIVKELVKKI
ncbi:MAG: hypothetical protein GY765_24755 [bacterium]|nr:hypothetical protein [bacterium]